MGIYFHYGTFSFFLSYVIVSNLIITTIFTLIAGLVHPKCPLINFITKDIVVMKKKMEKDSFEYKEQRKRASTSMFK